MKGNQVIGNYRLYKTIGEGAFAKVRCKQILKYNLKITSGYKYNIRSKNRS
jgi:hypothetical protein